jgi:hypothetical protein
MEAITLLEKIIGVLEETPGLALSAFIVFFMYKTFVIGSIYGVIKFVSSKSIDSIRSAHQAKMEIEKSKIQSEVEIANIPKDMSGQIDSLVMRNCASLLISQIGRLPGIKHKNDLNYVHKHDVEWLRDAIDEKLQREEA